MVKERLGTYISEYSEKNKNNEPFPVYSVTNSNGFCTEYFNKDVSSQDKRSYKIVPKGYFAYNPSRINVGSVDCQRCREAVIVSPLYTVFKVSKKLNQDYLMFFFKSDYGKHLVNSNVSGSVRSNLKFDVLSDFLINIESIEKQVEIVDQLKKIESLISCEEKKLDLYDELIKSRFIEMFGDPISNDKCWLTKGLNEVTDVRDGTHDSPKYHDSGYPFVTSKNLINGKIDFSTCQFISEEDYLHFNDRSRVDDGDILMPMIGTIGGAIVVKKDREFAIKNVALIKFNKDNSIINRVFILNILNSDAMNEYFDNIKKGGTQNFISLGLIRKIPTIVPPIELQNKFASFVKQIDKSKFIVQKRIDTYKELLAKKMDEYFN